MKRIVNLMYKQFSPIWTEIETKMDHIYNEVKKGNIEICHLDNFKNERQEIRKCSSVLKKKYSYNGLRFDKIFNLKMLYNGSDPRTMTAMKSAIKFQYISMHEEIDNLNKEEKTKFIYVLGIIFSTYINNNITYNIQGQIPIYSPIGGQKFYDLIKEIYKEIEEDQNYFIEDIFGNKIELNMNDMTKDHNKRKIEEDELIKHSKEFEDKYGHRPSIKEMVNYLNNEVNNIDEIEDDDEYFEKKVDENLIRNYVVRGGIQEYFQYRQ